MHLDEQIKAYAKEIQKLGGQACLLDIIRRMKQVMRLTAEQCSQIVIDEKDQVEYDKFFEQKRSKKEILDHVSNNILNVFLD